ncbi:hypothetical protein BC829DRAFT_125961 [Chytridium lagenaria]|nr:hypothetical protein BC829DRAFT_125961 [Chytridium lagenaria]
MQIAKAGKFLSIKHKYDILEDNMAILLRDYRKANSGVESVQASYRTLAKARSVYDEARINLPNFVYARSLLTNARLDGERIRVKLIDEYSGAWYEINEITTKHPTKNDFYVDPKPKETPSTHPTTSTRKSPKLLNSSPASPPYDQKRYHRPRRPCRSVPWSPSPRHPERCLPY